MANGYSWSASREARGYRLPGPDRLGWWAAVAMAVSILLHVVLFFAFDRMKIAFKFQEAEELSTRPVDVRQVEIRPSDIEQAPLPENVVQPPKDTAALLEDIEILDALPKNQDIDIKPEIVQAEYFLSIENPAQAGSPEAATLDPSAGLDIESALPEFGTEPTFLKPAEIGQITVDPGAVQVDESQLGSYTDELIQKGANGKVEDGLLHGVTSLDEMLGLPGNVLVGKKTMLPSDLLFEFNRSELRESAKIGLMKLGLLMDRNPQLFCWIEGHTDLVGSDEFNLALSLKRAEAVRNYLVNSMRMDASKIITRGFGRFSPIIQAGTAVEQAANRRVEILMRTTPPTDEVPRATPTKAVIIPETPPTPAPKAILVKPKKTYPQEVLEITPPRAAVVIEEAPTLRATAVVEDSIPLRAAPVQPLEEIEDSAPAPKASPVVIEPTEAIPRAQPVE